MLAKIFKFFMQAIGWTAAICSAVAIVFAVAILVKCGWDSLHALYLIILTW